MKYTNRPDSTSAERGLTVTANKARIVYVSINVGVLATSLLEYLGGVPVRFVIASAFIGVVGANAIVWLTSRRIRQRTLVVDSQPHSGRKQAQKQRNTHLWLGIIFLALGTGSATLAFFTTGIDIPSICSGLVSLAFGVILIASQENSHFPRRRMSVPLHRTRNFRASAVTLSPCFQSDAMRLVPAMRPKSAHYQRCTVAEEWLCILRLSPSICSNTDCTATRPGPQSRSHK